MFFKNLFTKAKPEKQENAAPNVGFFSTNDSLGITDPMTRAVKIAQAIQRSIQINPKDLKPVSLNGTATDATFALDACFNKFGGSYGFNYGGVPEAQVMWYSSQGFIGYQMCAIIAQHWLVDKACTLPARDAVRNGFNITVNDGTVVAPEIFDAIRELDNAYKLVDNMREYVRQSRIFGIRVCLFHVDSSDPDYYAKPFNIDGVTPGSYRGMSQIDPYWIAPELDLESASNPATRHFYEPTWWILNGKRYHRTHFVISRTNEVPDVLKPTYFYGGVSVPQKIYERVYAAERTANEAPLLTMTKRLTSLKLDITQALSNEETFNERMQQWTTLRDNFGVKVIGEGEEVTQQDTALGDLDNVIMTQYQIVAAIAEVPATKLLGTQPKGFNSSGEYEEASYHEVLESIQKHDLTPLVQRHHDLLMVSEIAPTFKIAPFMTTVSWNPLDAPTSAEIAKINLDRSQAALNWANMGAIDGMDERQRMISDPESGYNGMDEEMPDPTEGDLNDNNPDAASNDPVINQSQGIQQATMNGAQVQAMVEIVTQVVQGQLPRDSGISMLTAAFPLTTEMATQIMGASGQGFVAEPPPVPTNINQDDPNAKENPDQAKK